MLGSRSFTGTLTDDEIEAREKPGRHEQLPDALAIPGYAGRPRLARARSAAGYFEAHIEQGGCSSRPERRIGVVEAIIGNWNYWVTITGQQNHAGTTEMDRRRTPPPADASRRAHLRLLRRDRPGRAPCGRSGAS